MCDPSIANVPGAVGTTTPTPVGEPSPQSMVAVKSLAGSVATALEKTPMTELPGSALPVATESAAAVPGVSGGAAIIARPEATAVEPEAVLVIVTVSWSLPAFV